MNSNHSQEAYEFLLDAFIDKHGSRYPLLNELEHTDQDPDWHAEGNVFIHTAMVLRELFGMDELSSLSESDKNVLIYSAFFHDYGKPLTTKPVQRGDKTNLGAPLHEEIGSSLLLNSRRPSNLSPEEWLKVIKLVQHHDLPKKLVIKDKGLKEYFELKEEIGDMYLMYLLEMADMLGRICADRDDGIMYTELFKLNYEEYNYNVNLPDELYYRGLKDMGTKINSFAEAESMPYNHERFSKVIIMCGLPGSGKSTYAKTLGLPIISLDEIRKLDKKLDDGAVRRIATEQLKTHLRNKTDVIWDATNYRKDFRTKIADLAMDYNAYVEIHCKVLPYTECIANDYNREDTVGADVILKQFHRFQIPSIKEAHRVLYIQE
jgi:predicted kinase